MVQKTFLVLFLVHLGSLLMPLAAQPTYQYSLKECIEYALTHHLSVVNSQIDELAAKEQVRDYISTGLPQVNGSIDYTDFLKIPTTLIPAEFSGGPPGTFFPVQFGTKYNTTVGMQLTQLLFDGSFFVGLKAAKEYVKLTQITSKKSRFDVVANVSKAYYMVLTSEKQIELLDINLDRLQQLYTDTKAMLDAGFVEQIDLDRLEVNINNLAIEKEKVMKLIELTKQALKFQMGMPQKVHLVLTEKIQDQGTQAFIQDTSLVPYFGNRIEYQMLNKSMELQLLNIKRLKNMYLPTLSGAFSLQTQAFRTTFNFFDTREQWFAISTIGFRLNIPIFDGFKKMAIINGAKLEYTKLENQVAQFRQLVDFEYLSARTNLINTIKTLNIQQRNMDLAKEVFRVAEIKYKEGVGSNLEIITAESDFKTAQTNYYNSLLELYLIRIDYLKAMGTLYVEPY